MKAIIALEDGFVLEGENFGVEGERTGEIVFNTSMMGYQEILTDPSYKGQIVTMTYPLIGNYGVNDEDCESQKSHVEGFIVKENSSIYSNWRAQSSLEKFLKKNKIIGIQGVDTRALTRHIRTLGAMKAVISTKTSDKKKLIGIAKASAGLVDKDLVKEVTCSKKYIWGDSKPKKNKVKVFDCGVKHNILRLLDMYGCEVIVVPATTDAKKIFDIDPDGVVLSNGPGDPSAVFPDQPSPQARLPGHGYGQRQGGHRRARRKRPVGPGDVRRLASFGRFREKRRRIRQRGPLRERALYHDAHGQDHSRGQRENKIFMDQARLSCGIFITGRP